jgi:alpha-ketoglutarate-dependent taurine dioxygenase
LGGENTEVFGINLCPLEVTSRDLINDALSESKKPYLFYEHIWEEGDLVLWDNMQVLHRASGEYEG